MVPRAFRFIFCGRRRRKWLLQAKFPRTLPDAVRRNRFFALDFVFILGISHSFRWSVRERLGMPRRTARNTLVKNAAL